MTRHRRTPQLRLCPSCLCLNFCAPLGVKKSIIAILYYITS